MSSDTAPTSGSSSTSASASTSSNPGGGSTSIPSNPNSPLKGLLLVVSSPSGAGKTTLTRRLQRQYPDVGFSVSYTTRPPRTGERDGVDYNFIDDAAFDTMVKENRFAEWAHVHGYRYGTSLESVRKALNQGQDMIFDIDYQGGQQLKAKFKDAVMIFVLPPSIEELADRLKRRATDSAENIARRLAKAADELTHYDAYEYLIVNDDLDQAFRELDSIYCAARCIRSRRAPRAQELIQQAQEKLKK